MSSARKRSALHKAHAESDHLRQQLMHAQFHAQTMEAFATAAAKQVEEFRAQRDEFQRQLEVPEITEEMVEAYLTANNAYWKEVDALPESPLKWRDGTPSEATRISLRAALLAAQKYRGYA